MSEGNMETLRWIPQNSSSGSKSPKVHVIKLVTVISNEYRTVYLYVLCMHRDKPEIGMMIKQSVLSILNDQIRLGSRLNHR
ncbi:hypothetical protein B6D03_11235 [Gilliamella apicola]|nr:hypothetical protein B6D03_11235 [Gilliamella apicola]